MVDDLIFRYFIYNISKILFKVYKIANHKLVFRN